jgi:hypothetical protein
MAAHVSRELNLNFPVPGESTTFKVALLSGLSKVYLPSANLGSVQLQVALGDAFMVFP